MLKEVFTGLYSNTNKMVYIPYHKPGAISLLTGSDKLSNSIAFGILTLKSKLEKAIKPRKKVRFADDEGGRLETLHIYKVPCREETEENRTEHQNADDGDGGVDTNKVKQHVSHYKIVYNEDKLLEKGISVIAYGIIAQQSLFGAIEVKNITFDKNVFARVTTDDWKTSKDVPAKFSRHHENGKSDRFFFVAPLDDKFFNDIESELKFAACYKLYDNDFWDNNNGDNFSFLEDEELDVLH